MLVRSRHHNNNNNVTITVDENNNNNHNNNNNNAVETANEQLQQEHRKRRAHLLRWTVALNIFIFGCILLGQLRSRRQREEVVVVQQTTTTQLLPAASSETRPLPPVSTRQQRNRNNNDNVRIQKRNKQDLAEMQQRQKYHQIGNYKYNNALIVHFYIDHHGSGAVCNFFQQHGACPHPDCLLSQNQQKNSPLLSFLEKSKHRHNNMTYTDLKHHHMTLVNNVQQMREFYHMISWIPSTTSYLTFRNLLQKPNVVSILVVRDPMDRLADNTTTGLAKSFNYMTQKIFLPLLGGNSSIDSDSSNAETRLLLENIQDLLLQFTILLDYQCLEQGLFELENILGYKDDPTLTKEHYQNVILNQHNNNNNDNATTLEQNNDDLIPKNQLDIQLYQWSKSRTLVRCTS